MLETLQKSLKNTSSRYKVVQLLYFLLQLGYLYKD